MKTIHPINNLLLKEIDRFRKTRVFSSSDFVSLGPEAARAFCFGSSLKPDQDGKATLKYGKKKYD